ncbi:unnamed protein product [Rhizophagus irregularis]|uniref:Uncharacterized protein n=1 Tax=Rhizophagus irregularis TaxID=588596 RepID=A0A915Z059_9GLOM|nr:unnamed protein product [Rhizophagus irregularis]CAB5356274.1 unnamed protein product [Rhizophagus irregularis]
MRSITIDFFFNFKGYTNGADPTCISTRYCHWWSNAGKQLENEDKITVFLIYVGFCHIKTVGISDYKNF